MSITKLDEKYAQQYSSMSFDEKVLFVTTMIEQINVAFKNYKSSIEPFDHDTTKALEIKINKATNGIWILATDLDFVADMFHWIDADGMMPPELVKEVKKKARIIRSLMIRWDGPQNLELEAYYMLITEKNKEARGNE